MKAAEIRQKTNDELSEQLTELKKEALNFRFQSSSGQLESTAQVRSVRRDIARIMTTQNQRQQVAVAGTDGE